MAAKKKAAARRGKTCVVFRRAEKGGKALPKDEQKTVCFKKKKATASDKAKKARVSRMNLKRHACASKRAPKKACYAIFSR